MFSLYIKKVNILVWLKNYSDLVIDNYNLTCIYN